MDRPPRVVKFVKAELTSTGPNRCRGRVELKREEGRSYFGSADGDAAEPENLRCVAQATANALLQAVGTDTDPAGFEIRVKEIAVQDTFGRQAVLVAVSGTYFNQRRDLLGLCVVETDPATAAALAVLNATNRFLGVG